MIFEKNNHKKKEKLHIDSGCVPSITKMIYTKNKKVTLEKKSFVEEKFNKTPS